MVKSPLYWCSNSRKESDVIQQQREQRGDEGEQIWNKEPDKKKLGLAVGIRNLVRSSGSWNHRTNGRDRWRINSSQLRWRLWGSWKLRKTWDSLYEESRARRNNIEAEASTSFWDKNWLDWARARGSCFLNLRGRGSISTYRNILLQEQQVSAPDSPHSWVTKQHWPGMNFIFPHARVTQQTTTVHWCYQVFCKFRPLWSWQWF